ncbi:MAG: hypothetical protein JXJ18_08265 [Rhodobacteraceae bacterium]|nr:hypothetical protein [Paracoccaceae bacterium]
MSNRNEKSSRNQNIAEDTRVEDLSLVQIELQARNPDLNLHLAAQCHYGPPNFAFIIIFGADDDTPRRRAIRAEAVDLLRQLGHMVELLPGRDVYSLNPLVPESAHERLEMLKRIRARLSSAS